MFASIIAPYARYRYATVLHAVRLGICIVVAMFFNHATGIGHGEWTMITVFIVLGLLQYQGAIFTKAYERILGTAYGIVLGFSLHWWHLYGLSTLPALYFMIVGVVSAVIAFFAVKKLGYVGLLTGITMSMIIGDPTANIHDGLMRATNVLAGTVIVLVATVMLPLKSTLMWRFLLADNLTACSEVYTGVLKHIEQTNPPSTTKPTQHIPATLLPNDIPADSRLRPFDTPLTQPVDEQVREALKEINARLLKVRTHIEATASETGIAKRDLEAIQHTHRNVIGTLDLLLTLAPKLATTPISSDNHDLLIHYQRVLNRAMLSMAEILKSPVDDVFRPITRIQVSEYPSINELPFDWQGYFWLTQTLQAQLQRLSDLLQSTKPNWFSASGIRYQRGLNKGLNKQHLKAKQPKKQP